MNNIAEFNDLLACLGQAPITSKEHEKFFGFSLPETPEKEFILPPDGRPATDLPETDFEIIKTELK